MRGGLLKNIMAMVLQKSLIFIVLLLITIPVYIGGCTQNESALMPTAEPTVTQSSALRETVAPTQSDETFAPAIHVYSNLNAEDNESPDFYFVCKYDLDDDGTEDEIKLMVENYNEPTLVVGNESVKFSEHMMATYNCGSCFKVTELNGGKLIYFVSIGGRNNGYDVHCAYFENGSLHEVRFPEGIFFTEDKSDPFVGEWMSDNTFDVRCLFDDSVKHVTLNTDEIEGFEPSWRESGFDMTLVNQGYGPDVKGTAVHLKFMLTMNGFVRPYANVDCNFKFDRDTMSMTFVNADYSVYDSTPGVTISD